MTNKMQVWAIEERKNIDVGLENHYLYNLCKSRRRARIVKQKLSSKFPDKQFVISRFKFDEYTS